MLRDPFRNDLLIGSVNVPTLIVHGTKDIVVPIRFGEKLFALANPPKEFWRVEGAVHLALGERLADTLDWIAERFLNRRPKEGNLGRDGDRHGGELELHRNRSSKDVQDRAVRVNHLFELRQFLLARRALQRHDSLHPRETRTHALVDGKKSPQVAVELDRTLSSDAERCCVSAVCNLLACRQRRQDQLHRIRTGVRAAKRGRLVDRQRELANFGLAAEVLDLLKSTEKTAFALAHPRADWPASR